MKKSSNLLNIGDEDDFSNIKQSSKTLSALIIETEKLVNYHKTTKSVFDSTDGYTSNDDEEQLYSGISKDLSSIVTSLYNIIDELNHSSESGKDLVIFEKEVLSKIKEIESTLDKHTPSLQSIDWRDKIERRREDYKESLQEFNDIISDGKVIMDELRKITSSPLDDDSIIDEFTSYVNKVEDNLAILEEKRSEFENIFSLINKLDFDSLTELSSLKDIVSLIQKNKEIKESILKILDFIDALDGEIDEVEVRRNEYIREKNKKYKAKKGDKVDEMVREFLNTSEQGVEIKRMAEGRYMVGEKKVSAQVLNGKLLIRVGGGYQTLEEYLKLFRQGRLKREERKVKRETRLKRKKDKRTRTLRIKYYFFNK